jgi:tetratricopeptide (TPR) repeat protein
MGHKHSSQKNSESTISTTITGVETMTTFEEKKYGRHLPQITFSDKVTTPLELQSHKCSIQIATPLALVTSVLTFVNNNSRTLQGELVFPLPDDATVVGYALDVNGTMVDAVPIEKEKAKVVFEDAVRSGKGASVVEMAAKSNSFKTSVYPLHPNATRTIKIVYNLPVGTLDNQNVIQLPFGTPSESVSVTANIEWKNAAKVNVHLVKGAERVEANTQINLKDVNVESIVISTENTLKDNQVTVEGDYFCARIKVEQPQEKSVEQPNHVQILYDASYSRRDQHSKDTNLLNDVLNKLNPKQITFTAFSVDPRPSITCENIADFLTQFEKVVYDGATNLETVEHSLDENVDFCILLTDGIHTLGEEVNPESVYSVPMYIVTTTQTSNNHLLSHMATKSGGAFLNATTMSNSQIANKIGTPVLFFLVADYEPDQFEEVYPNEPVTLEAGGFLHLFGKVKGSGGEIAVSFKYGRDVLETREIQVGPAAKLDSVKDKIIPNLWAKQKLASLSAFPHLFGKELRDLAMEWKIVTANTSLIVLEELDQYLKHDITPPESLESVYKAFKQQKQSEKQSIEQKQQEKIRRVVSMWASRVEWHKKDYKTEIENKIRQQEEEKKRQQEEEEKRRQQQQEQQQAPVALDMSRSMRSEMCPPPMSMNMPCPAPPPSGGMPSPMMESMSMLAPQRSRSLMMEECLADSMGGDLDINEDECEEFDAGFADECKDSVMVLESEREMVIEEEEIQVEKKKSKRSKNKKSKEEEEEPAPRVANTNAAIKVQKWTSDSAYMTTIKESKTPYETYLELRQVNQASPAFFLDVADYWLADLKNQEQGLNILTNVLELELESEQLLRIAAYRLDQEKRWDLAEMLFEKVLEMRPDQPQSHRDLALVKEKLGKLEEAADLLNQVIYKEWDSRYDEVELTATIELNHVLAKDSKLAICDERLRHHMDLDLRVSMA